MEPGKEEERLTRTPSRTLFRPKILLRLKKKKKKHSWAGLEDRSFPSWFSSASPWEVSRTLASLRNAFSGPMSEDHGNVEWPVLFVLCVLVHPLSVDCLLLSCSFQPKLATCPVGSQSTLIYPSLSLVAALSQHPSFTTGFLFVCLFVCLFCLFLSVNSYWILIVN